MDGYTFHERRLSRGEILLGLSGSVAAHVLVVAAALILPWAMPRKTVQVPFYSVNLVSAQDFGAVGSGSAKKGASSKSAEAPRASGGEKAASPSRRRAGSSPVVPVKRLQFDEPRTTRNEAEVKKLAAKDVPEVAEPPQSSASIEKDLDSLIPKPKARTKPTAITQEPAKPEVKTASARDPAAGRAPKASEKEKEPAKATASGGDAPGTGKGETAAASKGSPAGSQGGSAAGSAAGGTAASTGGSSAGAAAGSTDGAAVGLARRLYYTEVWNAIRRQWALPEFLKSQKLEAVLVVVVRRDGKIVNIRFEKKSGQPLFDESVDRAVRKADPLPPFPEIYSPPKEEIGLRFRPEDFA